MIYILTNLMVKHRGFLTTFVLFSPANAEQCHYLLNPFSMKRSRLFTPELLENVKTPPFHAFRRAFPPQLVASFVMLNS